jgi:hypothetical protein
MIVNSGIVDMHIAVGEHRNQQDWIDCAPGDRCPQLAGAACNQPFVIVLFQVVDSISEGLGRICVARNQIQKATCEVVHIDLTKM